jgi:hypothetical protein
MPCGACVVVVTAKETPLFRRNTLRCYAGSVRGLHDVCPRYMVKAMPDPQHLYALAALITAATPIALAGHG